ncbi:unnamed protein product [Mortierella alpina]
MEIIPDLTHYAAGLDPATFPLRARMDENSSGTDHDGLSVIFTVATLESIVVDIVLSGQGFRVLQTTTAAAEDSAAQILPERQQEARLGMLYETLEALLMALSPGFEQFFGDELSRKLGALSSDRFYREERDSGSDDDRDQDNHKLDD